MNRTSLNSPTCIKLQGVPIPGAGDRHHGIAGFDQQIYSRVRVLCIGAGGLISNIAPALCRKGIGALTILDDDEVEASNLNRQRFYPKDIGKNKAVCLVHNLQPECTFETQLSGYAFRLEEFIEENLPLDFDVVICGVDNNPARVLASEFFRSKGHPVIFCAVSADADHGYVFIQEKDGPCFGCLFPDAVNDDRYPCPGTPAMLDILQLIGGLAIYAVDSMLLKRKREGNYWRASLSGANGSGIFSVPVRRDCPLSECHEEAKLSQEVAQ